ncbi:MAG: hypothetical protein RLZZ74_1288 [Cyanobacteriota bacterium]
MPTAVKIDIFDGDTLTFSGYHSVQHSTNQAIALGAAVDYLNSIGMEQIHAYEEELTPYLF